MSLHTCTSGQTTHQKAIWKSHVSKASSSTFHPWFNVSSPNGLSEVHWLHVAQGGRRKVSKERREVFIKGTVQDVRDDFQVSIICSSACSGMLVYVVSRPSYVIPNPPPPSPPRGNLEPAIDHVYGCPLQQLHQSCPPQQQTANPLYSQLKVMFILVNHSSSVNSFLSASQTKIFI